jgi:zinc protease
MTDIHRYTLDNGLRLVVHTDKSTPLVAINLLYDVGSRDEQPEKTGFAHLFEHLMFGGTRAIPDFDRQLEMAGGESNAFTNCDITNYYITIPASNIETALWLESDRMRGPELSQQSLKVQQDVVSEEFRQRFLNQPYGDAMLHLRPLVYKVHPYRWPTIGMNLQHIADFSLPDVKSFFSDFYTPDNAILTIAGNIEPGKALKLVNKWFGTILPGNKKSRALPHEPEQYEARRLLLNRPVPANVIYKAWVVPARGSREFHIYDMLTDILSGGESGRLYTSLVRERRLFNEINCFLTGDIDRGMMIVIGALADDIAIEDGEKAIDEEIGMLKSSHISPYEYEKVQNRFESEFHLNHTGILPKATALSYNELLGDASLYDKEVSRYKSVTTDEIVSVASSQLTAERCSTLIYIADNQ